MLVDHDPFLDVIYVVEPTVDLQHLDHHEVTPNLFTYTDALGKVIAVQIGSAMKMETDWIISKEREDTPLLFQEVLDRWFDLVGAVQVTFAEELK